MRGEAMNIEEYINNELTEEEKNIADEGDC